MKFLLSLFLFPLVCFQQTELSNQFASSAPNISIRNAKVNNQLYSNLYTIEVREKGTVRILNMPNKGVAIANNNFDKPSISYIPINEKIDSDFIKYIFQSSKKVDTLTLKINLVKNQLD